MSRKIYIVTFILVICYILSCAVYAENKFSTNYNQDSNIIDKYFKYAVPEGFSKKYYHTNEYDEIIFTKNDLNISITAYPFNKENYNCYLNDSLNGRESSDVTILGLNGKEGFTDIDHCIAFKYNKHIIELFAYREGSCFSNISYNQNDKKIFSTFINSIEKI